MYFHLCRRFQQNISKTFLFGLSASSSPKNKKIIFIHPHGVPNLYDFFHLWNIKQYIFCRMLVTKQFRFPVTFIVWTKNTIKVNGNRKELPFFISCFFMFRRRKKYCLEQGWVNSYKIYIFGGELSLKVFHDICNAFKWCTS